MISKRVLALFILSFMLALLALAPASILAPGLDYATRGRLTLANTSGTVWSGAGTISLRQSEQRLVALQDMHWKLLIPALFSGKIQAQLQWGSAPPAVPSEITADMQQTVLRNLLLQLPARLFEEISPMLKPAQFRGQLQVQADQLVFTKRGIDGVANIDWQQASSALSSISPLGNYHLVLSGAGENVNIVLTTTTGILLLEGQGVWSAVRGLEFHGKARAAPGSNAQLNELLHHLGREEAPGVYGFNLVPQ
ncbi:MAG: type II secretion system protein N [Pseudomonadota bacterium]